MWNANRSFNDKHSQILTLDDIARKAPSVFAQQPYEKMSEKYRFFPTSEVVNGMIAAGFQPVHAQQSRCRIEGKSDFTKHLLRFRHTDLMKDIEVNQEVPEIVLLNSHDGTSSYQISLGLFRKVCSNGLMVSSGQIADVRVRHSGRESLIQDVIEGTYSIIKDAPIVAEQIDQWKHIKLEPKEQALLARAGLDVRETTLDISDAEILRPRRFSDSGDHDGTRDLWRTFNTIQENLIKGGPEGVGATGRRQRIRGVNSVDGDTKLNRALWQLAEGMANLKAAA